MHGVRIEGQVLSTTVLSGADLQNASLLNVQFLGTAQSLIDQGEINLRGATANGSVFRYVDFSSAEFDDWTDLRNSFGDASVKLPEGVERPCGWSDTTLPDAAFFCLVARLDRGWAAAMGRGRYERSLGIYGTDRL